MKVYQTFVQLDGYETEALQRLQKAMSETEGREFSKQEAIRAALRYAVHDLLGKDYVLGRDAKSVLEKGS